MDIDELWLRTLQEVVGRAAHEVKDALNAVSLNLEVIRSRAERPAEPGEPPQHAGFLAFATAAAEQLELVSMRTEAILFLGRAPRPPADVSLALRHLASLLVPAAKADGGRLTVEGHQGSAPTSASATAMRLALASGLLAVTRNGGSGACRVEQGDGKAGAVVRFSHESAAACTLDTAVVSAIAEHSIRMGKSGADLLLVFPGQ